MKIYTFIIVMLFSINTYAQLDKSLSKKEWKTFVKEFNTHIDLAEDFFKDQYDLKVRDEFTGSPISKIPIIKCSSHFFDVATYGMFYKYEFISEELAKEFISTIKEKITKKLP